MAREQKHRSKVRPSGDCPKCGTWRRTLHRDHVIPTFKGGPDTPDNWQYICANCHEDKTSEDMRGRRHTPEVMAKIRATRGIYGPISEDHRRRLSEFNSGRRHRPESIDKIRQARLAYWSQKRAQG